MDKPSLLGEDDAWGFGPIGNAFIHRNILISTGIPGNENADQGLTT